MKKLTYIALGFVLGSLGTIFVIRSIDTNESRSEQTTEASESKLTFDFSVSTTSFVLTTHDESPQSDRFSPQRQRSDYSSAQPEFIRERLAQEAYDIVNPYSIHNDEWKNRDYGLYVFSGPEQ